MAWNVQAPPDRETIGPVGLAGGVRLDTDPLFVKLPEASLSENFAHSKGRLIVRPVLAAHATFVAGVADRTSPWSGLFRALFDDGNALLFVVNDEYVYVFNGANWIDVSNGALTLGADNQLWDACYGIDGDVGGFLGTGTVFLCNDANEVLYFNPTDDSTAVYALTSPNVTFTYAGPASLAARYCVAFRGRIVFGYTSEGGSIHDKRTRITVPNKFTDLEPANGAQAVDHAETSGEITGLFAFDDQLLVLKRDSIVVGVDAGDVIVFPRYVAKGCIAGRSFKAVSPFAGIFLGTDDFYLWESGQATPIGKPVVQDLFSRLNHAETRVITAHVDFNESVYRCWIPVGTSATPTRAYCLNWKEKTWWVEEWPSGVYAVETVDFAGGVLLEDLTEFLETYTNLLSAWGPTNVQPVFVASTAYTSTDFRLMELAVGTSDATSPETAVTCMWESGDVEVTPGQSTTVYGVRLHYTSGAVVNVSVGLSVDHGKTQAETRTLAASTGRNVGLFDFRGAGVTGRFHRLRIALDMSGTPAGTPFEIHAAEFVTTRRRVAR